MQADHESALALALELLAQEIIRAMPAQERPDELESALALAFNTLGLAALSENRKGVTP